MAPEDICKVTSVLVVDDMPVNREIAAVILRAAGHDVDVAASADEAIAAVAAKRYSVVLMDMQMPERDGLDATRSIRALRTPAACVPVIALSAYDEAAQIDAFRAAGCDDYLGKPFDFEDLKARVAFWASRRSPAADLDPAA